jgi:hypothetical protein
MMHVIAKVVRAAARVLNRAWQVPSEWRRITEVSIPAETAALLDQLRTRYSMEVLIPATPFCIRFEYARMTDRIECRPATSEQATWYVPRFAEEFGLYPPLLVPNRPAERNGCGLTTFSGGRLSG